MPAGSSTPGTARILITLPSIAISWISTTPATLERASTSRESVGTLSCMKAPVAFCCGTVARTHGSLHRDLGESSAGEGHDERGGRQRGEGESFHYCSSGLERCTGGTTNSGAGRDNAA